MTMGRNDEDGLSPREQRFCIEYVECENQSEAYRRSYSSENMKRETVERRAIDVMNRSRVKARIAKLMGEKDAIRAKMGEKLEITLETTVKDLTETATLAKQAGQFAAATQAYMGRAKVLGLVIDKKEITLNRTIESMTSTELDLFIEHLDDQLVEFENVEDDSTDSAPTQALTRIN
jgi:phage terminase small subunit